MKLFFAHVVVVSSLLISTTSAATEILPKPQESSNEAKQEAAGLPNLASINQTNTEKASATATVQTQVSRTPSFYYKGSSGTEITEYRARGKITEIKVRSGLGTHYYSPLPADIAPTGQNNGLPNQRLPAVRFSY